MWKIDNSWVIEASKLHATKQSAKIKKKRLVSQKDYLNLIPKVKVVLKLDTEELRRPEFSFENCYSKTARQYSLKQSNMQIQ